MSRVKDLNPAAKILSLLAVHEEFEQYKIKQETKISYPTILKHIKDLEKREYIRLVRTEHSEKGGKEKKIYKITFKGLVPALMINSSRGELEQIIKSHPDASLTFKKYPLFKKEGLSDFIVSVIHDVAKGVGMGAVLAEQYGYALIYSDETERRNELDKSFLYEPVFAYYLGNARDETTPEALKLRAFVKFCKEDPEIKAFIDQEMTKEFQSLERLQSAKEGWNSEDLKKSG